MDNNYEQFLSIFLSEADDNLKTLEEEILFLEEDPSNEDRLNAIFRAAHTIKGSSGLVGQTSIQHFTHALEDYLDAMRKHQIEVNTESINNILQGTDVIKSMIENIKQEKQADADLDFSKILNNLDLSGKHGQSILDANVSNSKEEEEEHYYFIHLEFPEDVFNSGTDPLMFFGDLVDLGTFCKTELIADNLPEVFDHTKFSLKWNLFYQSKKPLNKIKDIFLFIMDDSPIEVVELTEFLSKDDNENLNKHLVCKKSIKEFVEFKQTQTEKEKETETKNSPEASEEKSTESESTLLQETSVKVPTSKLDKLLNLVSELVIAQSQLNMMSELFTGREGESLRELNAGIEKLSRSLQEETMQLRMVKIGPVFYQFKRLVRDASKILNKSARLIISGDDTELDKNIFAQISDPLKHMIRNAIDHGLEIPKDRLDKGKPETGVISLNAYQEENNVVIEVSDDGKGLNTEKIFQKAVSKGLIAKSAKLRPQEIHQLIFHPGLSTAAQVTDLSGRGVGMDVVLSNIKKINGEVEIHSKENEGSTFKIKLPLTLAIIEGMLLRVGKEVFIIPIHIIEESTRPTISELKTVSGRGELYRFRNEYITLLRLYQLFGIEGAKTDPEKALLIVIKYAGTKVAVLVDDIQDQQQVVMKGIDSYLPKIHGISSATILGSGNVALVLDVNNLIQFALEQKAPIEAAAYV